MEEIIGKVRIKWDGRTHIASLTRSGKLLMNDGQVLTVMPESMAVFKEKMIPVDRAVHEKPVQKEKKQTSERHKGINLMELLFRLLVILMLCVLIFISIPKGNMPVTEKGIAAIRAAVDIPKGTRISGDMLEEVSMPKEHFRLLSSGIYITKEGSSIKDAVLLSRDRKEIEGCYAAMDILKGEPLSVSDISFTAPSALAGFVQVEVNGRMMDIPLDPSFFENGIDTKVDIVAVFSGDGSEGTKRALLASFTLEDRQLKEIYTRAGEGIMEKIENADAQ